MKKLIASILIAVTLAPSFAFSESDAPNMVDERFELVSLIFRLAGSAEYSDVMTDHQREIADAFAPFSDAKAVDYARGLSRRLGYDAVFSFAMHLQRTDAGFELAEDISSLTADGRWSESSAREFVPLVDEFYAAADYQAFFDAHEPFYQEQTRAFIDGAYGAVDFNWFERYVDVSTLVCVYSPSSYYNNYGAYAGESYCVSVSGDGTALIHELCHSFANPQARDLYANDAEFKRLCDETITLNGITQYAVGNITAGEYLTRAYNVLYDYEHASNKRLTLFISLGRERSQGFPYIDRIVSMLDPTVSVAWSGDRLADVLDASYTLGDANVISIGARTISWRLVTVEGGFDTSGLSQTEVGNAFGSSTGDALYVEDTAMGNALLFDLGETTFQGRSGYRAYCRIQLD